MIVKLESASNCSGGPNSRPQLFMKPFVSRLLVSRGCHAMKYGKDLISRVASTTRTPAMTAVISANLRGTSVSRVKPSQFPFLEGLSKAARLNQYLRIRMPLSACVIPLSQARTTDSSYSL
jgi:hypothetical protein